MLTIPIKIKNHWISNCFNKNHYTNFQNIHLCFPLKFKSKANINDLAAGTVTLNNEFAYWIRELNTVGYGDERPILPTTNMVDVYGYSDELLKHMPKEDLTTMKNNLLYCKEKVILTDWRYRRANNVTNTVNAPKKTDANLTKGIEKFQDQLKKWRYL